MRLPALLALLLLRPAVALACSGPGAAEAMARNDHAGWFLFGVSAALAAVTLGVALKRHAGHRNAILVLILAGAHPALRVDVYGGDCGQGLLSSSLVMTAGAALLAAWSLLRPPAPPEGHPSP